MTNAELAQICSAAAELGSSIRCVTDTNTGSGNPSAIPTQRPETIRVTGTRPLEPAYLECGFGDIQAIRRVECDLLKSKHGYSWVGEGAPYPGGRATWRVPAPPATDPESLKHCVSARIALDRAKDALRALAESRPLIGPDGKLPKPVRDQVINALFLSRPLISNRAIEQGFPSIPRVIRYGGDPDLIERLQRIWIWVLREAHDNLSTCRRESKQGKL